MSMNKTSFFIRVIELLLVWHQRRRERRQLLTLNDWQLKDMGLSRGDAYREGTKPFWRG